MSVMCASLRTTMKVRQKHTPKYPSGFEWKNGLKSSQETRKRKSSFTETEGTGRAGRGVELKWSGVKRIVRLNKSKTHAFVFNDNDNDVEMKKPQKIRKSARTKKRKLITNEQSKGKSKAKGKGKGKVKDKDEQARNVLVEIEGDGGSVGSGSDLERERKKLCMLSESILPLDIRYISPKSRLHFMRNGFIESDSGVLMRCKRRSFTGEEENTVEHWQISVAGKNLSAKKSESFLSIRSCSVPVTTIDSLRSLRSGLLSALGSENRCGRARGFDDQSRLCGDQTTQLTRDILHEMGVKQRDLSQMQWHPTGKFYYLIEQSTPKVISRAQMSDGGGGGGMRGGTLQTTATNSGKLGETVDGYFDIDILAALDSIEVFFQHAQK